VWQLFANIFNNVIPNMFEQKPISEDHTVNVE